MRLLLAVCALAVVLSGCNSTNTGQSSTPTRVARALSTSTAVQSAVPTVRPTSPISIVSASAPYRAFLAAACKAFSARDVPALRNMLSYYQYNSGLRYGNLGDGEGQNGDPSLFSSWLASATVRCTAYTADQAGHATLLTSGWHQSGGAALIDLDTFNGVWKFNDFTFGTDSALRQVMGSNPVSFGAGIHG